MAVRNGSSAQATPEPTQLVPMSQVVNQLFRDSFLMPRLNGEDAQHGWSSSAGTNLWMTEDGYIAQIALPGVKPDSISISVDQHVLTVEGDLSVETPQGAKPVWNHLGGQTQFRLSLPSEVNADAAQANYEYGVLSITIPKANRAKTHTIKVTSS